MASSGEKNEASSPPLRRESENSETKPTEAERPTLDGGVFGGLDEETRHRLEASAKLENPFHGLMPEELRRAMIAGDMNRYDAVAGLTTHEREALDPELTHKWRNPSTLYAVIVIYSLYAAVQGMDETVDNGAQYLYRRQFGIGDPHPAREIRPSWNRLHLLSHLCRYLLSASIYVRRSRSPPAWQPLTHGHGRNAWWHMFIVRFFLGFGVGPKSATTPIFAAKCSPLKLRGALSPRWYLTKTRHLDAYKAVSRLRYEKVRAARALFYVDTLLQVEREGMDIGCSKLKEILTQFCGVNAIAYYSAEIFIQSGFQEQATIAASLGFSVINWLFALPCMYTIETFGRRKLLLTTFPFMLLFLFLTGFSFWIPQGSTAHLACITVGIYLFGAVYSPGEGRRGVPAVPTRHGHVAGDGGDVVLHVIISLTWPSLVAAWAEQGAFSWYASWNLVGFVAVLLFLSETKEKTLEELDAVSDVPVAQLVRYGVAEFFYSWSHYVLHRDAERPKPPPSRDNVEYARERFSQARESDLTLSGSGWDVWGPCFASVAAPFFCQCYLSRTTPL
ncbi:hypothetical protein DL770_001470 [Monosporascus sp. CRB-9-2]|nr:hypothetical protein DL770_001470 [Monosporascus sp. CRB-9-2]